MFDFSALNKTLGLAKSKIQFIQKERLDVLNATPMSISDIDKMMKYAIKGDVDKLKKITNKYIKE